MKPFKEEGKIDKAEMPPGSWGMHGDVCIFSEDKKPPGFDAMVDVKDACLAYGEATGHAHKIFGNPEDFTIKEDPKTKERHLLVVRDVVLKHQEHKPVVIPPGQYRIGIQREYDPYSKHIRQVVD